MQIGISKEKCLKKRKDIYECIIEDIEDNWKFENWTEEETFKKYVCERKEEDIVCFNYKTIDVDKKSVRVYFYSCFNNNCFYTSSITLFKNENKPIKDNYKFKE